MQTKLSRQLEEKLHELAPDAVVAVNDFTDIAQPKTVSKMLSRLAKEGRIQKVMQSIYWLPLDYRRQPDPDEVARALARENDWNLAPAGETAIYLMGLSEEAPEVWTYVTDGTYRKYAYGEVRIEFNHTKANFFRKTSANTRLLIQSIRALGTNFEAGEKFHILRRKISGWNMKKVIEETEGAAEWVKDAVKRLYTGLTPRKEKVHEHENYKR